MTAFKFGCFHIRTSILLTVIALYVQKGK